MTIAYRHLLTTDESSISTVDFTSVQWRVLILSCMLTLCLGVQAEAQSLTVSSPRGTTEANPIQSTFGAKMQLKFTVTDTTAIPKVRIVDNTVQRIGDYTVNSDAAEQKVTLNLLKGRNTITLYGYAGDASNINPASGPKATIWITCDDDECGKAKDFIVSGTQEGGGSTGAGTGQTAGTGERNITLKSPSGDVPKGPVDSLILVTGGIKKLSIVVYDAEQNRIDYQPDVDVTDVDGKLGVATPKLKLSTGENTVRIFDPAKPKETANETKVNCPACSKAETVAVAAAKPEQKGSIKIIGDKSITYGDKKEVKIKVAVEKKTGEVPSDKTVVIEVTNKKKPVEQGGSQTIPAAKLGEGVDLPVKIQEGLNQVTVYEQGNKDGDHDYIEINCEGKCGKAADVKDIAIVEPTIPEGQTSLNFTDKSTRDATVTVAKGSAIKKVQYEVIKDGETIFKSPAVAVNASDKEVSVPFSFKFVRGENIIRVFDAEHPGDNNDAAIVIICDGPNCATDLQLSTIVTNSQNTRVIVGLEQAGASSSTSTTKPFLDFFFTTPVWFDHPKSDEKPGQLRVPRAGFWGDVRLASTPEQLTTTGILPSNLANLASKSGTASNLVQSFDFLAGLEARLFTAKGSFLSLIPGIRQKTRFYIAGGFGAISPLDAQTEAPKFSLIPGTTSSQRALFEQRYGIPPASATHIALVPLDRDRFFRQWYAGIRLKTFYCEQDEKVDLDCNRFRNSFPAIVDFMIGQNQSATGGSFKKTGTIDPATGIGKEHQAFVFRLDGFYPLPFREANFIYFYGTAIMNIFGKQNIENFLVLDPATDTPNINTPAVYVPPSSFLRALQSNRDYYKIGVGINLTDFFNRNKPKD